MITCGDGRRKVVRVLLDWSDVAIMVEAMIKAQSAALTRCRATEDDREDLNRGASPPGDDARKRGFPSCGRRPFPYRLRSPYREIGTRV